LAAIKLQFTLPNVQQFVKDELKKYTSSQPPSEPEPQNDVPLRPTDRQDMLQAFLDAHPGTHFRRELLQDEFGFSMDQTQKALRHLKQAGRIGYQETNALESNPRNPKDTRWRKDAVYFSVKDRPAEPPLPVTLKTMDEVRAFID